MYRQIEKSLVLNAQEIRWILKNHLHLTELCFFWVALMDWTPTLLKNRTV